MLSFEEWKRQYATVTISEAVVTELRELHSIDAVAEADRALQKEYQQYLNSLDTNS